MSQKDHRERDQDLARLGQESPLMAFVKPTHDDSRPETAKTSVAHELPLGRCDNDKEIALWQASAHDEEDFEDTGIIARILRACIESLTYLAQPHDLRPIPQRDRAVLRRCAKLLKLWATGHGAWDSKLDSLLDRSKNLRHTTLSILSPLCKVLSNSLDNHTLDVNNPVALRLRVETAQLHSQTKWLTLRPEESSSDSSDSDSDASGLGGAPTELGHLAEDVKTHIDCLTELSSALEFPAEDPEDDDDETSALRVEPRTAHGYHADLILAKFPKAQIELAESLGRISWDRYQRMQQERECNSSANAVSSIQEQHTGEVATKSRFADSEFQDSGLGTSLQVPSIPATRYAETIISYMTSMAGGKRVQIPPLSAEAKAGAKFECNACGKYIFAQTNREWRKHLFLDLQPYTCFYASCSFSSVPFADRQLWSDHLELHHHFGPAWESVTCPLCLEATEPGKSHTLIHFARHMEDIALAALPREVESDGESDGDTNGGSAQDLKSEDNMSELLSQSEVLCNLSIRENGCLRDLGNTRCGFDPDSRIITFTAEDDVTNTLLSISPTNEATYRKEEETTIHWTVDDGRAMVMQFSRSKYRDRAWRFLNVVRGFGSHSCSHEARFGGLCVDCGEDMTEARDDVQTHSATHKTNHPYEAAEKYAAPESYWSIEEQQSFRDYIRQYGTNWTTIAQKMGTKTSDMVRAQYFRNVESGDTELEQMAEHASIYNANSAYAVDSEVFRHPLPDPPQDLFEQRDYLREESSSRWHGFEKPDNGYHDGASIIWCPYPMCARSEHFNNRPFPANRKNGLKEHVQKVHGEPTLTALVTPVVTSHDTYSSRPALSLPLALPSMESPDFPVPGAYLSPSISPVLDTQNNHGQRREVDAVNILAAAAQHVHDIDSIAAGFEARRKPVTQANARVSTPAFVLDGDYNYSARDERKSKKQEELSILTEAEAGATYSERSPVVENERHDAVDPAQHHSRPSIPEVTRLRSSRRSTKLPRHALDQLHEWLDANQANPYPDVVIKRRLAQECGITEKQVSTWMTNARTRLVKSPKEEVIPAKLAAEDTLNIKSSALRTSDSVVNGPYSRRSSICIDPLAAKESRIYTGKTNALLASRAEASRERWTPRISSRPDAVPAFGSNVWRAPAIGDEEKITIKCICSFADNDGDTVLCELCDTWQHVLCYYDRSELVPQFHQCSDCSPRQVNPKGTTDNWQRRRKVEQNFTQMKQRESRLRPKTNVNEAAIETPLKELDEDQRALLHLDSISGEEKIFDDEADWHGSAVINRFARELMETCNPEVQAKFEQDVKGWPEDKKQLLEAQGISPKLFRFRQHAEMMYRTGRLKMPNETGSVPEVTNVTSASESARNDLSNSQQISEPVKNDAPAGSAPNGNLGGKPGSFDPTGQIGPPGVRPRMTASLWEDENTLVFQVESKQVCVARREDNHMINGTKLLDVAGITRGRRDGILKCEPTRHVVKIGPMYLKGVWIPFERALEFANKEQITDMLYPLFVHDIGALLYRPINSQPTTSSMQQVVETQTVPQAGSTSSQTAPENSVRTLDVFRSGVTANDIQLMRQRLPPQTADAPDENLRDQIAEARRSQVIKLQQTQMLQQQSLERVGQQQHLPQLTQSGQHSQQQQASYAYDEDVLMELRPSASSNASNTLEELYPPAASTGFFVSDDTTAGMNRNTSPSVPVGWETEWDDRSSKYFFVNIHTKASQWERPTESVYALGEESTSHTKSHTGLGDNLVPQSHIMGSAVPVPAEQTVAVEGSLSRPRKMRATCDACSRAKARCDKVRPTCHRCSIMGVGCNYSVSTRIGKPRKDRPASENIGSLDSSDNDFNDLSSAWPAWPFSNSAAPDIERQSGKRVALTESTQAAPAQETIAGSARSDLSPPHSGYAAYDIYHQPQASQLLLNTTFEYPFDMEPQVSPDTSSIVEGSGLHPIGPRTRGFCDACSRPEVKIACNGAKPTCQRCSRLDMTCNYSPPKQPGILDGPYPTLPSFNSGHVAGNVAMSSVLGQPSHQQQTMNDRPFKCDLCPQSFDRNHDLQRHKRIHLRVKPFPCNTCDKSFSRKEVLRRHVLVESCGKHDL